VEQIGDATVLELELDLVDRRRLGAAPHLALVECELDLAFAAIERNHGAMHPGFENRLERARELLAEQGSERRVPHGAKIRRIAFDRLFPFVAGEAGGPLTIRLEGLNALIPDMAHAQRHAAVMQLMSGAIEVDRDKVLLPGPSGSAVAQAVHPLKLAHSAGRNLELEFDFGDHRASWCETAHHSNTATP